MTDKLLSSKEVSELFHVSEAGIRMKVHRGQLPSVKFGKRLLFKESDIQEIIDASYRKATN